MLTDARSANAPRKACLDACTTECLCRESAPEASGSSRTGRGARCNSSVAADKVYEWCCLRNRSITSSSTCNHQRCRGGGTSRGQSEEGHCARRLLTSVPPLFTRAIRALMALVFALQSSTQVSTTRTNTLAAPALWRRTGLLMAATVLRVRVPAPILRPRRLTIRWSEALTS